MVILAFYSVWNEEDRIGASIGSIHRYVDKILVMDGRYEGFWEGMPVNSTDHTIEIARKFPKVEILTCSDAMPRHEKLNLAFTKPSDWYLHIDADHVYFGDLGKAFRALRNRKNVKAYRIQTYELLQHIIERKVHHMPRLFHTSLGFRYVKEHSFYIDNKGREVASYAPILEGVWCLEMSEACSEERVKRKMLWRIYYRRKGYRI